MSLDPIFNKEFARRNLWEAVLCNEYHVPIPWTRGLIRSTNIPKIHFQVDDIYAGTSKGYAGWKLPENLSISIWETSDHQVEKYLDEWMTGETGVFDLKKGVFRKQTENRIYRRIRITTFIYEYTKSIPYTVNKHQSNKNQKIVAVEEKQVIPVLDKITAAVGGLANQAVAKIPFVGSDITRRFIPPVIIPPPLMRVPIVTGTPIPYVSIPEEKDIPVSFTGGDTTHAKQWTATEKITSRITYTTAIESYDIGTYDYSTGDGVSYTVNLAVRDMEIDRSV